MAAAAVVRGFLVLSVDIADIEAPMVTTHAEAPALVAALLLKALKVPETLPTAADLPAVAVVVDSMLAVVVAAAVVVVANVVAAAALVVDIVDPNAVSPELCSAV